MRDARKAALGRNVIKAVYVKRTVRLIGSRETDEITKHDRNIESRRETTARVYSVSGMQMSSPLYARRVSFMLIISLCASLIHFHPPLVHSLSLLLARFLKPGNCVRE